MSIESDELRETAAKCRRLAGGIGDRQTVVALKEMAADYEHRAERMDESERRLHSSGGAAAGPQQN